MIKKPVNFRIEPGLLEDLKIIAKINTRTLTNQVEALIVEAKEDLKQRGKWPVSK